LEPIIYFCHLNNILNQIFITLKHKIENIKMF